MAKDLTYKSATEELEQIANQIENDEPDIDELASLVKRAKELIQFCKSRLKSTESEIDEALKELED
ncbi:MAG: exodeoxyribonuclease VII small subunit [Cyclobacteriaceae bacterium]